MTIEELLEIERIRALRDTYASCLDDQDAAKFGELFCDDAVCEFPDQLGGNWVGKNAIVSKFAEQMATLREPEETIHVVTNPWITLTGPDTAHGRCYLIDLRGQHRAATDDTADRSGAENPLLFLGMYEDDYRKVDNCWKFARLRLPFFWSEPTVKKFTT